ncbi:MAG: NAD-dependent succinate-semialdehyde dehydrogenase [Deltaproteobacteria bacterium]|nr:NAD-dependent succinate-semialdehyde dehydrogenase [Deltaproteobacteria bacterium]
MSLDPAARALVRSDCYIDGAWVASAARFAVTDPATDLVLAEVPDLDAAAVERAIAAATAAFPAWRARSAYDRAAVLAGMAARMRQEKDGLAALITAENGKPLAEAAGEVAYAASFLEWFAGEAVRVYGETVPASSVGQRIEVQRAPVGPCALITPWNFPAAMLTRKLGPALAVGCTVVCKPAEATPLTTLALAGFAHDLGVPPGVINVVTGDGARIGGQLVGSLAMRKVSFTGSTAVGRSIARVCAETTRRVSLELGGNAPFVVLDDADLDRALAGALVAKFRNAGQSCVAANRFIVQRPVAQAFTDRLAAAAAALVVGDGRAPGVSIGPLVDRRAVAKVRRLVEDALARGARLVTGTLPADDARWIGPIVLAEITGEMAVWREEIFGPVVAIRACDGDDEAIALANDTDAGLVAYVFGRDPGRLRRVTAALEVGMVGVNEGLVSTAQAPFGGIKASGLGREGSHHGLEDYTDLKYVMERVAW